MRNDLKFKDKVVLVTGSAKGIGKSIGLLFAQGGARVVINYLNSEKEAKETLNEINKISDGIILKCDVSQEIQVKEMIEKVIKEYGRLDILVNNAGGYIEGDEWNGTSDIWEKTLKQNLISVMNTSKYATEIFQKQKNGIIVNISSRYSISGNFDEIAYATSKAGVISITQAYAKLLNPFGRANAISPGATNSGYWLCAPEEELKQVISSSPHKRLINPEEIAKVVLFLASDESLMITGQNILVDGGNNI
ncbi:MAG: SDR family oxidoreductase [Candidatus Gracilibacteria bacterium]|nr:SDR family oxidoreductase [Candidatus Gracilibacteria bacterium]MDD3119994.1 SDR family oxidoreductase [Candidatus Gracilibacteria bacterium]MDD4529982.1 SDR family oxidoreductase [Candidatus Gracilibacteria bacterium]